MATQNKKVEVEKVENVVNINEKVKIKRNVEMVPWSEVQNLFYDACNLSGASIPEVMSSIGYSNTSHYEWQRIKKAPLRVKYSLMGLIADLGGKLYTPPAPPLLSVVELSSLITIVATTSPDAKDLLAKLTNELQNAVSSQNLK